MAGIFGRVVGGGIEIAGTGLYWVSRGFSQTARGAFWLVGKHLDMMDALKNPGRSGCEHGEIDAENLPDQMLGEKFEPIALALKYSQSAYEARLLPLAEIVRIDGQARIIAQAMVNILPSVGGSAIETRAAEAARTYLEASDLFLKYHCSGKDKWKKRAEAYLADAEEQRQLLRGLLSGPAAEGVVETSVECETK